MDTVSTLINKAISTEIRQIKLLAVLASLAPDELTRDIILEIIKEEAGEAKFWNTVDAAYRGVLWPGAAPYPGVPGYGGPAGPGAGLPVPPLPGFFSEPGQKEEKK